MDETRQLLWLSLAAIVVAVLLLYWNLWRFGIGMSPREKRMIKRSLQTERHYNNLRILGQERHQEFPEELPCATCEDREGGVEGDTLWKCIICEKLEK